MSYKPRNAQEIVISRNGNKELQPDENLVAKLEEYGIDYNEFDIAIIGEVTLQRRIQNLRNKFNQDIIRLALNRFGLNKFLPEELEKIPVKVKNNTAVVKMFFSKSKLIDGSIALNISFTDALKFIKERMKLEFKKTDWAFFDDPFIQYIIFENIGWK